MSAFNALKSACRGPVMFEKFDNILPGEYSVREFKFIQTRFGRKVVVVTEDFMCFLPERFAREIASEEAIDELNRTRYIMKYRGKDAKRHNLLLLDFEVCTPQEYADPPEQEVSDAVVLTEDRMEQEAPQVTWRALLGNPSNEELANILNDNF